jgi:GH25 family lysozyme M1 (1,4-beta-N-acetylmuramidase)
MFSYRQLISVLTISILLANPITPASANFNESPLLMSGPGARIHGADISRWQHPFGKSINFKKMHKAGVRFVMIKASDSRDESDQIALKWVSIDRKLAQAAGIYTGFYHYARLPDVSTIAAVEKDARVQAQKVIWRLASLGGYNERDLPYALDLENNCVSYRSDDLCSKYAPRVHVTAWAKEFLSTLKEKTGRTPILYSYPEFLENAMVRDAQLRQYPLWLAHYALDPFTPTSGPGVKNSGCYVHSWTNAACKSQWVMWQYTSCGIAPKYGVPGNRLDLNVFRGSEDAFRSLTTGVWIPEEEDLMPVNETSTMKLDYLTATYAGKDVLASVQVFRPDGSPVVTGDVKFVALGNAVTPKFRESSFRTTSGMWKISISGLAEGTYTGEIRFTDRTGTHKKVSVPISFTLGTNPNPIMTPSPKPEVSPSARPSDSCRRQVKN